MKSWIALVARFVVIFLAIATVVSMVAADAWWIRVFDFPRLQIAIVLALAIVVLFVTRSKRCLSGCPSRCWRWLPARAGVPYFAFMPKQAVDADECAAADRLHMASLNVLQDNRISPAIDYLREEDPDIFLAMENDAAWTDALSAALDADYPYSMKIPQPNTYGMAMWSRLPFAEVERNELAGGGTPSIKARVNGPTTG